MNILMFTNTYLPHVGGVARSIERFARFYRWRGHHVRIVAPEFDGPSPDESDVIRVAAMRHFNRTDYSLALPVPQHLGRIVDAFEPDIVHSHHPFLLGGVALRIAHSNGLPLVFTHHTRYEDYTHNLPIDSPAIRRFAIALATRYANLAEHVFVPSESIRDLVRERGVTAAVDVVPTGVDVDRYAQGDGARVRRAAGIPPDAFVVGHLGRLSSEKNLGFLARALARFVMCARGARKAHCLIVGAGPDADLLRRTFDEAGIGDRLHMAGPVDENGLADAYHAMDVFAFASTSETQGMVLTEAMAAGRPVVALDAPGVREVVSDLANGRLLMEADVDAFANLLVWMHAADPGELERLARGARNTAARFTMQRSGDRALELYSRHRNYNVAHRPSDFPMWTDALHLATAEWQRVSGALHAAADAARRR